MKFVSNLYAIYSPWKLYFCVLAITIIIIKLAEKFIQPITVTWIVVQQIALKECWDQTFHIISYYNNEKYEIISIFFYTFPKVFQKLIHSFQEIQVSRNSNNQNYKRIPKFRIKRFLQIWKLNVHNTGFFRINAHDVIASYAPWENFYAPGEAALCSVFHVVFVQVVFRTREHD